MLSSNDISPAKQRIDSAVSSVKETQVEDDDERDTADQLLQSRSKPAPDSSLSDLEVFIRALTATSTKQSLLDTEPVTSTDLDVVDSVPRCPIFLDYCDPEVEASFVNFVAAKSHLATTATACGVGMGYVFTLIVKSRLQTFNLIISVYVAIGSLILASLNQIICTSNCFGLSRTMKNKVAERISLLVMCVAGSVTMLFYGAKASCVERLQDSPAVTAQARHHYCTQYVFAFALAVGLMPILLLNIRFKMCWFLHLVFIICIFGFRFTGPDDTTKELVISVVIHVVLQAFVAYTHREVEKFHRKRYETAARKLKQQQAFQLLHSSVESTLVQLLPGDSLTRLINHVPVVDVSPDCAILHSSIANFPQWCTAHMVEAVPIIVGHLVSQLDIEVIKVDIEKIATFGDSYVAAHCLRTPSTSDTPDHTKLVLLARRCLLKTKRLSEILKVRSMEAPARHRVNAPLRLQIGVAKGRGFGGMLMAASLRYVAWGPAMVKASYLSGIAAEGQLLVCDETLSQCNSIPSMNRKPYTGPQSDPPVPCSIIVGRFQSRGMPSNTSTAAHASFTPAEAQSTTQLMAGIGSSTSTEPQPGIGSSGSRKNLRQTSVVSINSVEEIEEVTQRRKWVLASGHSGRSSVQVDIDPASLQSDLIRFNYEFEDKTAERLFRAESFRIKVLLAHVAFVLNFVAIMLFLLVATLEGTWTVPAMCFFGLAFVVISYRFVLYLRGSARTTDTDVHYRGYLEDTRSKKSLLVPTILNWCEVIFIAAMPMCLKDSILNGRETWLVTFVALQLPLRFPHLAWWKVSLGGFLISCQIILMWLFIPMKGLGFFPYIDLIYAQLGVLLVIIGSRAFEAQRRDFFRTSLGIARTSQMVEEELNLRRKLLQMSVPTPLGDVLHRHGVTDVISPVLEEVSVLLLRFPTMLPTPGSPVTNQSPRYSLGREPFRHVPNVNGLGVEKSAAQQLSPRVSVTFLSHPSDGDEARDPMSEEGTLVLTQEDTPMFQSMHRRWAAVEQALEEYKNTMTLIVRTGDEVMLMGPIPGYGEQTAGDEKRTRITAEGEGARATTTTNPLSAPLPTRKKSPLQNKLAVERAREELEKSVTALMRTLSDLSQGPEGPELTAVLSCGVGCLSLIGKQTPVIDLTGPVGREALGLMNACEKGMKIISQSVPDCLHLSPQEWPQRVTEAGLVVTADAAPEPWRVQSLPLLRVFRVKPPAQ